MSGHALDLSLKFTPSDRRPTSTGDNLRFVQVLFDFVFDLTLRDNCIQWRFRPRILPATAGPDPVSPIDLFDRILISGALSKCKRPTKLLLHLRTRVEFTSRCGRHSHPEQTRTTRTN